MRASTFSAIRMPTPGWRGHSDTKATFGSGRSNVVAREDTGARCFQTHVLRRTLLLTLHATGKQLSSMSLSSHLCTMDRVLQRSLSTSNGVTLLSQPVWNCPGKVGRHNDWGVTSPGTEGCSTSGKKLLHHPEAKRAPHPREESCPVASLQGKATEAGIQHPEDRREGQRLGCAPTPPGLHAFPEESCLLNIASGK